MTETITLHKQHIISLQTQLIHIQLITHTLIINVRKEGGDPSTAGRVVRGGMTHGARRLPRRQASGSAGLGSRVIDLGPL